MSGQRISGSARMSLREMFPNATEEQIKALNEGMPVPPSPEWLTANASGETQGGQSPAVRNATELPLVSCVMVFSDAKRMRAARKAVNQFVAQTYEKKQLVIINATDQPVTNVPYSAIKEVRISERNPSIGFMRTKGIQVAEGGWIKQWDDDDIYDPLLLAYQMGCCKPGHAVLLTHQIRVHTIRAIAYMHRQPEGIAGTILFPKQDGLQYPDISLGEDRAFWISNFATKTHLVNNYAFPLSAMQTAAYHGHNVLPVEQFMIEHHSPEFDGRIELPELEAEYLKRRLVDFGLQVKPVVVGSPE